MYTYSRLQLNKSKKSNKCQARLWRLFSFILANKCIISFCKAFIRIRLIRNKQTSVRSVLPNSYRNQNNKCYVILFHRLVLFVSTNTRINQLAQKHKSQCSVAQWDQNVPARWFLFHLNATNECKSMKKNCDNRLRIAFTQSHTNKAMTSMKSERKNVIRKIVRNQSVCVCLFIFNEINECTSSSINKHATNATDRLPTSSFTLWVNECASRNMLVCTNLHSGCPPSRT